ncbi:unnamed protein product, partial [Prunus brigantina]
MRTIFKSHGIWDLVEKGLQIPDSKGKKVDDAGSSDFEKEALLMKDAKALGIIQGAVSEDVFPRISNEETSKGAWDILHQEFHGDKQVRSIKLQGLRRDFEYTRMRDDETLSGYLTRLLELVNQMKGYGEDLSKGRKAGNRRVRNGIQNLKVMSIKEESMNKGKNQIKQKGNASTVISSIMVNAGLKESQSAMGAIVLDISLKTVNQIRLRDLQTWPVSACSNHMTAHESLLIDIDRNVNCKVKMGIGDLVQSIGKGTLAIDVQGVTRYIREVMIVPGLDENLLSVGQMIEHGHWLVFGDNEVDIYEDKQLKELIARVQMKGNICFPLDLKYVNPPMANIARFGESGWLWHIRFGHLNYISLKLLQEKDMVQGLPKLQESEKICSGCAIGKSHRSSFDKEKTWRASQPLELIHSDICGPMQTITPAGNIFFLTFIDDYTRMCWVFFLQHKSQVLNVFKRFKSMVELQSGYKIKKLRSDRGGEYTSLEFLKFCDDVGMERQLTVAYSPQQNGVAERKNRTIVEMARTMMAEKRIPLKFWVEAVNTAVYLQNRSPTSALDNITPFKKFSGRKPDVKHLRIFGSLCYIHIPSQKRHKLEETGENGVFVGYGVCEKGYRVL